MSITGVPERNATKVSCLNFTPLGKSTPLMGSFLHSYSRLLDGSWSRLAKGKQILFTTFIYNFGDKG
jgi:hypothetical protein